MSIYQGLVIMSMSLLMFKEPIFNIVTITFTALILIELLNVISEVSKITKIMLISMSISVIFYLVSILCLTQYLDIAAFDLRFLTNILMVATVSWLPLYLIKLYMSIYHPSEDQKIMMETKGSLKETFVGKLCLKLKFWKKEKTINKENLKELMEIEDD